MMQLLDGGIYRRYVEPFCHSSELHGHNSTAYFTLCIALRVENVHVMMEGSTEGRCSGHSSSRATFTSDYQARRTD